MFAVDQNGKVHLTAEVHLLYGRGTVVEWRDRRVTEHDDVPWFLFDIRPQGFLGRSFVAEHADLRLPALTEWRADDVIRALALRGEDLPGNLILGEESHQAFYRRFDDVAIAARAIDAGERARSYPELAESAMRGGAPGSSAGGEQPKFTCLIRDAAGLGNVIVKFSPPTDGEPGRRWADLLACEHLALELLRGSGLPAAESQLLQAGGRVFLEVSRFDRIGSVGRRPVVSLAAVDDEFIGRRANWAVAADELHGEGRLSAEGSRMLRRLEAFGRLIFNTDRHSGNVSFFWDAEFRLDLAPIYDMLPMAFAPESGVIVDRPLLKPTAEATLLSEWDEMRDLAKLFWTRVSSSDQVSSGFKEGPVRRAMLALG
jgi:hypothetical protein